MLSTQSESLRVANPIETAFLSDELWQGLQVCRIRGLLNDDLMERLLDGMRSIDSRDWDEEDANALLIELLGMVLPGLPDEKYMEILRGKSPEFYC